MDTIAINANEALKEDGLGKKKFKVSDTAKAAMAAGVVGATAGAAGMSMTDEITEDVDEVVTPVSENLHVQQESVVAETETADNVVVEVNPDDVMLEEPVAEPSLETDMIAEAQLQSNEGEEYQPFANNDWISDDILPEPQQDEVLIAENTNTDVVVEEVPVADVICGMPDEVVMSEPIVFPEEKLCADDDFVYGESDVQSDLMG